MLTKYVKISKKGQIAIPKKIREKLKSDILEIEYSDGNVVLKPVETVLTLGKSLQKYAKNAAEKKRLNKESDEAWENHVKEKFGSS